MLRNSDRFHAKRNVTHSPGKQFTVWRGFSTVMTGHQRWFVHPSQSRCWMMIFLCFLQHLWGKANCATWHLQLLWLFWLPSAAKRPHENPNPGTQYGMRSKHIRASLGQGRTPRFKTISRLVGVTPFRTLSASPRSWPLLTSWCDVTP